MSNNKSEPLGRVTQANLLYTLALIIFGLVLMVVGNNDAIKDWRVAGGNADDLASNVGLAILIAAATQYYTDFRVRGRFYKDISDHVAANETLRQSGILKYFADSKECSPKSMLHDAKNLDIGVTYSDRFLKDYSEVILNRKDKITVRIFRTDLSDDETLASLAHNNGISKDEIKADGKNLDRAIKVLTDGGIQVSVFNQKFIPHCSFYIIDSLHYFFTISTFASRKATVPLFQTDSSSQIAILISKDIETIIESQAVAT